MVLSLPVRSRRDLITANLTLMKFVAAFSRHSLAYEIRGLFFGSPYTLSLVHLDNQRSFASLLNHIYRNCTGKLVCDCDGSMSR